jgi:2-polyprenyl-6-hydroxyphenyl methylase/3-demethylubiquinone-9 3-methyltransferase
VTEAGNPPTTIDQAEIDRFAAMASDWWNPAGKFRPLHKFNPIRLGYIKGEVCRHFGRDRNALDALDGLTLLDIGCGGGLLCEPLTRLGANVTGIDPAEKNIGVARLHASQSGLAIDYRTATAEDLAAAGEQFDVVLAMEVIEHVADVDLFLDACAKLVKPGGLLFVATLNRTLRSFALAIVGAEYVLRWLPVGTHQWDRFVKPQELNAGIERTGLRLAAETGVVYDPIADRWRLSHDMAVNYAVVAEK